MQTATTSTPEYVINASKPIPLPVKKLQKKTTKHTIKDLLHQNYWKSPNSAFTKERTNLSHLSLVQYLTGCYSFQKKKKTKTTNCLKERAPRHRTHRPKVISKQIVAIHLLHENITLVTTNNASVRPTQLKLVPLQSPACCSLWKLQYCNKEETGLQPALFSIN